MDQKSKLRSKLKKQNTSATDSDEDLTGVLVDKKPKAQIQSMIGGEHTMEQLKQMQP